MFENSLLLLFGMTLQAVSSTMVTSNRTTIDSNEWKLTNHGSVEGPRVPCQQLTSPLAMLDGFNVYSMVVSGSPKRWYVAYNPPEGKI